MLAVRKAIVCAHVLVHVCECMCAWVCVCVDIAVGFWFVSKINVKLSEKFPLLYHETHMHSIRNSN